MFKFISTLLIGILSASLAVIYQNDIATLLGRAPVTAQVTAGGWYPHPQELGGGKNFTEIDEANIGSFSNQKESNFARIIVSNNTGRDIANSFIKIGDSDSDVWKFDAVILRKNKDKTDRFLIKNANDKIDVGALPAAQDTTIYLWSNRGFSYPFGLSDIEILTSDGRVKKSIVNIKGDSDDLVLGISTETIAWIFVFVLLLLCVLLLFLLHHGFSFSKALLKDEDYYLSERIRFDSSPDKYSVPDTLPKK